MALAAEDSSLATLSMSLAVIVLPVAAGALLGLLLRRLRGRRVAGVFAAGVFSLAPPLILMMIALRWPLIGLWDALLEGWLIGAGMAWTAHRALAGAREVALGLCSLLASLLVLEMACRLFLPAPPGFATAGGPHFWLADAMRAGSQQHSWGLRSKEIVCSVIYEEQYPGILDVSTERDIVVPRTFVARAGAARRVLHLGDSMTFGFGVARDQTFTAQLGRIDPDVQHINAAIPGVAPDAYLVVLQRWLAIQKVDLAVMHLFEGNDLDGLDDHYPCCHWQSLLVYGDDGGVAWRCPQAAPIDLGKAGSTWLRYNTPPPFLVRALIGYSSAAAHMATAIINTMPLHPLPVQQSVATQLGHLEAILRSARDELAARGVPFLVVVLPSQSWMENRAGDKRFAPQILQLAQRLQVRALDAADALPAAVIGGRSVFLDNDPHFSPTGHAAIAAWLHDRLTAVAPPPPSGLPVTASDPNATQ